jgi:hypothetical protein
MQTTRLLPASTLRAGVQAGLTRLHPLLDLVIF